MRWMLITGKDKDRWNRFVSGCAGGSFAQSYEWGEVKSGTWIPYYTAVEDDSGTLRATGLVLKRQLPGGLFSVLYCPRGPVFSGYSDALMGFYFRALETFARQHRAIWFRCDPEIPEDEPRANLFKTYQLKKIHENIQPRATIILDLQPSEEDLLKSFHHKTRYNIRLAEKKGVTVIQASDHQYVDVFYDLFRVTGERDRFMIMKKNYFYRLWDVLFPKNMCAIFIAMHEGTALGAVFLVVFGDTMTYVYGASSNEKRHLMPNHLLHWRAIQWAKQQGLTRYDFWGIPYTPQESSPLWGVYRFKKGFCETETRWMGACERVYYPFLKKVVDAGAFMFKSTARLLRTGTFRAPLDG